MASAKPAGLGMAAAMQITRWLLATAFTTLPTNLDGPAKLHHKSRRSIALLRAQQRCEDQRIQVDFPMDLLVTLVWGERKYSKKIAVGPHDSGRDLSSVRRAE